MAYSKISLGDRAPQVINAIVEIPKGSHNKYEYDEEMDEIRLDRVLHSPLYYPADYGFIPHTRSDDGDHMDILVFVSGAVFPGCIVSVRPIGVLDMEDESGRDWKIIAVAEKDPRQHRYENIEDIDDSYKNEIRHFFEQYKMLENKWVKVNGYLGKEDAYRLINEAQDKFAREKNDTAAV